MVVGIDPKVDYAFKRVFGMDRPCKACPRDYAGQRSMKPWRNWTCYRKISLNVKATKPV